MNTIRTSASVKVMRSFDYCHFEASMSLENEEGVSNKDIDDARKDCNRLTDKAVEQYKKAKQEAANRTDGQYKMQNFEATCKQIAAKSEQDRTIREIAMLKQYENENWRAQFDSRYDYDDDDEYYQF